MVFNFFIIIFYWRIIGIQYWFQGYSIVVQHLYTLWNDLHDKSRSHLSPYKVTTILLAIFPMLYIASPCIYYMTGSLYVLILFTYFIHSPTPSTLAIASLFSLCLWVSFCFILFVHLFCFIDSTYKRNHIVFAFLCLNYFTKHNTLQVYPCCCKWKNSILFYGWVVFHCVCAYVCITSSLSIWMFFNWNIVDVQYYIKGVWYSDSQFLKVILHL